MNSLKRRLSAATLFAVLLSGSVAVSSPAYADDPVVDRELSLTEFRAGLVSRGATADATEFDAFTSQERSELADYLVGETDLALTPPADATWDTNGVATYGNFTWGTPGVVEHSIASNSTDIYTWGTRWFSSFGIKSIEVKNSMTYTTTYSSQTGTRVTAIKSYACQVILDTDIFAEVTSTKNSAFPMCGRLKASAR